MNGNLRANKERKKEKEKREEKFSTTRDPRDPLSLNRVNVLSINVPVRYGTGKFERTRGGRKESRERERGASGQRFAFLRGAIISPAVSVQQWGQISRVRSVDH